MNTLIVRNAWMMIGAVLVTLMAAFHGVIAENLVHLIRDDWRSHLLAAVVGIIGFAVITAVFWNREYFVHFLAGKKGAGHAARPVKWGWVTSAALFVVTLLALAQGLLALNFAHLIGTWFPHSGGLLVAIGAGIFLCGTWALWALRDKLLTVEDKLAGEKASSTAHAAIVMMLSTANPTLPDAERFSAAQRVFKAALGRKATSQSWQKGIDALTSLAPDDAIRGWNIQQPLRALKWLVSQSTVQLPLFQIDVICSKDSAARYNQFAGLITAIIAAHPHRHIQAIKIAQRGERLVQNDLQYNYNTLRDILCELESDYPGRTVTIDITGGTADFSVAGAMATLSRKVQFSYINTNSGKNIDFDVHAFAVGMANE